MTATQCIQASRCGEDDLLKFKPSIRTGKKGDLRDLNEEWLLVQTDWSEYFTNCWSTGIFNTTISRVYREWSEKEKISSERQLCGRKRLVDVRGQRWMDRLVRDDRKTTVTQINTRYNQDLQNTISEHTTHRTLKQMDSSSRRPHGCRSGQIRTAHGGYKQYQLSIV